MQQPITVARENLKISLAHIINENTDLPAFVIIDLLENMITQLTPIAQKQYQNDKIKYDEFCKMEKLKQQNETNNDIINQEVLNGDTE